MPLYRLVQEELRRAIATGKYPAGTPLPSERELTERFGVSSITVRRALDDLASAGLIERGRGRRARVRQPRASAELEGSLQGLFETILVQGWNNEVTILEFGLAAAPENVAAAMSVEVGAPLHCTVSLMRRHGKLICHARHWVPVDIGQRIQKQQLLEVPRLLLMMRLNIRMERAYQSIASCPAPSEMVAPFEIAEGSPMLRIVRTTCDDKDRGVEHVVAHFPWDRFEYRMSMRNP
jgi:GntR family transcriptional regulator